MQEMVEQLEIEKKKFHSSKKATDVNKMEIKRILISNEFVDGKNKEIDANTSEGIKLVRKLDHYSSDCYK